MSGLRKSLLPSNGALPAGAQQPSPAAPSAAPSPSLPAVGAAPGSTAAAGELPAPSVSLSDSDLASSFKPTEAQVRAKAKYLSAMLQNPLAAGEGDALTRAKRVTKSAALAGWWKRPGFREWFLNESAVEERLEWLQELSLSAIESILLNEDPRAQGARLSAAKLVAEMTGRAGKQPQPTADDKRRKAVDSMNKDELKQLLESQGIRIEQVAVVDAAQPQPKS